METVTKIKRKEVPHTKRGARRGSMRITKNCADLEAIERRVGNIQVSMLDAKELYDLKGHVGDVRGRLNHWRGVAEKHAESSST